MTKLTKTQLKKRNQLVEENIDIVGYIANTMTTKLPAGISREDILSIGSWGLIEAANRFNPEKGVLFKTFASTRIRGAILDELRKQSLGGQTVCRKARMVEKAVKAIEIEQNGAPATEEQIAKHLEISIEKLQAIMTDISRSFLISLDELISNDSDDSESVLDTISDHSSDTPDIATEKKLIRQNLINIIKEIPEQEQKVLTLYYYEKLNFKEIGMVLEVSESRVSQIHSKAIIRMRSRLKREYDE